MATRMILGAITKRTVLFSSLSSASTSRYVNTLVIVEHEGGAVKAPSISAVAAAKSLSDDSSISVFLAGSARSLHQAASHAASCHPSISQVFVADSDKFKNPLAEP